MNYNGTYYYYVTDLQGDVVAILNSSGTSVVTYTYDAWGKLLTTSGTMASALGAHNPLRYRGYVHDTELGLYYLQSRYYNPALGRFINADQYPSTGQGFTGNNMFIYCGNNPVNHCDKNGNSWTLIGAGIIASVVSGIANALATATNGGSVEECVMSGLVGMVSGAIGFGVAFATGFSTAGNIAARAVSSTICDLGTAWVTNGEITEKDIATTIVDVTIDVCYSTITYYYTDPIQDTLQQTFVNGFVDGSMDVAETYLLYSQPNTSTPVTSAPKGSGNRYRSNMSMATKGGHNYAICAY